MTEHCTAEQREHMLDLVKEMQGYAVLLQDGIRLLTIAERIKIGRRMAVIVKEMKDFRRNYPDD